MYRMNAGDIADHYRDVCSALTLYGFDNDQRAELIGKSASTMKHYGGDGDKKHARMIPVADLDRLREKAVELYWEAAADPYRVEMSEHAAAAGERSYITPTYIALDIDGKALLRHPHPIRCQEIADRRFGSVIDTQGAPPRYKLDSGAALRSNWRRLVAEFLMTSTLENREEAYELLCDVTGVCRYSFFRVGLEHERWRLQPTPRMVLAVSSLWENA